MDTRHLWYVRPKFNDRADACRSRGCLLDVAHTEADVARKTYAVSEDRYFECVLNLRIDGRWPKDRPEFLVDLEGEGQHIGITAGRPWDRGTRHRRD